MAEALSADTTGYARADRVRALSFPDDHGPHPDYRTEWWYYTGNLRSSEGERFGFQLTFFRTALRPDTTRLNSGTSTAQSDTSWSTRQLYMAHLAIANAETGRFESAERFSRGAAGLAGAQSSPYRVWLEDWSANGANADSVRLRAGTDAVGIDLTLVRRKPIVLQGDRGLDRKGSDPGNASYYYSMTRMTASGRVTLEDLGYAVEGLGWMDHEWSTSALGEDQIGWDWFALQLDSGRDVMYYRLRRNDGEPSPFSGGVVVDEDGAATPLRADDVALEPETHWRSPATGTRYPVAWSFQIPSQQLSLRIEPILRNQELAHSITYWEGAVRVSGSATGVGFVELTGYGESDRGLAAR